MASKFNDLAFSLLIRLKVKGGWVHVKLEGVRDFYSLKPKRNVFGQEKMWHELTNIPLDPIFPLLQNYCRPSSIRLPFIHFRIWNFFYGLIWNQIFFPMRTMFLSVLYYIYYSGTSQISLHLKWFAQLDWLRLKCTIMSLTKD